MLHASAGLYRSASESLRREAAAILHAAVADLRLSSPEVIVPLAAEIDFSRSPPALHSAGRVRCHRLRDVGDRPRGLDAVFRNAAAALIVAPESDGLLTECVALAERLLPKGARLLNLGRELTEVFSDKLATDRWLREHDLPSPATWAVTDAVAQALIADSGSPACSVPALPAAGPGDPPHMRPGDPSRPATGEWILKPRDGVGSDRVTVLQDAAIDGVAVEPAALRRIDDDDGATKSLRSHPWVLQHRVAGQAHSVGLVGRGLRRLPQVLPAAEQLIASRDGRLTWQGGRIPAAGAACSAIACLARRVAAALGPFWGYVGIDLLWDPEAPSPVIVDVNPRLCTSFAGYAALLDSSCAFGILQAGDSDVRFRPQQIRFDLAGRVTAERSESPAS